MFGHLLASPDLLGLVPYSVEAAGIGLEQRPGSEVAQVQHGHELCGDAAGGQISDVAIASYLAKYATKSTEAVGMPPGRITADNAEIYATLAPIRDG
jgi:hypothetical protein